MNDHFERIYRDHAEEYDALVAAEDCDGRILPAIQAIHPLRGISVAEVGVGTGRLTRLLIRGGVRDITGVDRSPAMLAVARRHLDAPAPAGSSCLWRLAVADASTVPAGDGEVDLAIAGWVFGHQTVWNPEDWQEHLTNALAEFDRITRPGGTHIVLETLGTGVESPAAPTEQLSRYYAELETRLGFQRRAIRTDYRFASAEDAAAVCGFFFGEELAARIRAHHWARVPEWTGIWWRRR